MDPSKLSRAVADNIKSLTWRRPNPGGISINHEELARCCPLDTGRYEASNVENSLGAINALPTELITYVLLEFDLRTLTAFRAVNQCARLAVDRLYEYKVIITHTPFVLRTALSLNAASWITCSKLFAVLRDHACVKCGHYGTFIYLFTCERVCFLCLSYHVDYLPLTPAHAMETFALTQKVVSTLGVINTLPGYYMDAVHFRKKRILLVDRQTAKTASIKLYGSYTRMKACVEYKRAVRIARYQKKLREFRSTTPPVMSRRPHCPPYTTDFDKHTRNPLRFMAVVLAPLIQGRGCTVDWGLSCTGCQRSRVLGDKPSERIFASDKIIDHIKECVHSRDALICIMSASADEQLPHTD